MTPKRKSKKSASKIQPKTKERIVATSLQHPELGARRLVPLLKKKRISVSAAGIQRILRREGLQSREKRLAKLKKRSPKVRKTKSQPKKHATQITDEVGEHIVEISLQNPELGAKGLAPLLEKQKISISSSAVYRILKRRGLQTREKRLAETAKAFAEPVFIPKTFPKKIPAEVEGRIIDLSLQNPESGAKRLIPLLQEEGIEVSASAVYKILRRNDLENRQKRHLHLETSAAREALAEAEVEGEDSFKEPAEKVLATAEAEMQQALFEPAINVPILAEDQAPAPADMPEPSPQPVAAAPAEPERPPLRKKPAKLINKMSHWVFYPLYLLLLALVGYLGLNAFQAIQYAWLETNTKTTAGSATVGIAAKDESDASVRPFDSYRRIWERNLFNIAQARDSEPPEKISLDTIALAKKDLGLELVGTVVADDPQMNRAIIDNHKIREQKAYREGGRAGGVRIKKILRNNVVITTAEGDELLTVETKETTKSFAAYTPAQNVSSRPAVTPQATDSRQAPVRSLPLNLKREEVAAALADLNGFMKQLTITPYRTGDQSSGFMIRRVTPQNILRKMGLRSRDVITAINDEAVTGPEQAAGFFERLSQGGEITINFRRRRRNSQIRLNIE